MFINKWLVTDSIDADKYKGGQAGLCLYLDMEPGDIGNFYKFFQNQPIEKPFAILLSGDDFDRQKADDSYIEKILGLFFQPSYFLVNYQPLLFLNNRTSACSDFLARLVKKSINQGLQNILILEIRISHYPDTTTNQFAYWVTDGNINYNLLVKNWLAQFLDNKNPTEIHLLISAKEQEVTEILNRILEKEISLKDTEDYKIASTFYQKQKLIEGYKHELSLKMIHERDTQLYLSIQKEERANGLKWYYYEYEILPVWYKRFGHIIKVLMGKRSFRSLFNKNVKKYKD